MPSAAFEKAAKEVREELTSKPSDDDLLKLYGLYKQATIGDNETGRNIVLDKPLLDMKGRYKWDAWNDLQGMLSVEAEIQYIDFVEELKAKHK